jgi:endonuclease/exonuclease/phosphatase family metal-dependent hydrolase
MMAALVCSWNVHECVGRDGRRDPARVAAVLEEIAAEVMGLQEVHSDEGRGGEHDQVRFLAGSLSIEAVSGPTLERRGGRYGNVLLTRLPVSDVRRHDLSVRGREPRGALEVTLDSGGGPLRVVSTHLGLRAAERAAQARRLLHLLGRRRSDETLVLLGDLNEWQPWGTALRLVGRRFGRAASPRTFPAWRPLLALDRVWVDPRRRLQRIWTHRTPRAGQASDHLPLVARVGPGREEGR